MKIKILGAFFLLMVLQVNLFGQAVKFSLPDHISVDNKLSISITSPLNSDGKSDVIKSIFFINNESKVFAKALELQTGTNRFIDSSLIKNVSLHPGIHSFFLSFPDASERVYSCFVSSALAGNTVKNVSEIIAFKTNVDFYNLFLTKVKNKISQNETTPLLKDIPAGLKCIVSLDFFSLSPNGFNNQNDSIYCSISQYNLTDPTIPPHTTKDAVRDTFLSESTDSPIFGLLSAGWLLDASSFKKNMNSIKDEIFTGGKAYSTLYPIPPKVDDKIIIGINDQKPDFHRLIILINN